MDAIQLPGWQLLMSSTAACRACINHMPSELVTPASENSLLMIKQTTARINSVAGCSSNDCQLRAVPDAVSE